MIPNKPWIEINDRDTKRIQRHFGGDKRIQYGFNKKSREFQAWYIPANSHPYMITNAQNADHAIHLMNGRAKLDSKRAKDLLREIDDHNDQVHTKKDADAMLEIRSQLRDAAIGKRYFTPVTRGRAYTHAGKGL